MNFENNFVLKIKSLYFNHLLTEDYIHFRFYFLLFDPFCLPFALACRLVVVALLLLVVLPTLIYSSV